jgi:hypothetical protein
MKGVLKLEGVCLIIAQRTKTRESECLELVVDADNSKTRNVIRCRVSPVMTFKMVLEIGLLWGRGFNELNDVRTFGITVSGHCSYGTDICVILTKYTNENMIWMLHLIVRCQVLTAADMNVTVFWDIMPCSLIEAD